MRSLSSSRQIRTVRAARQRAVLPGMVITALRRSDGDPDVSVAIVAGRSVGNAVARNRAKRRLRAAARAARLPAATDLVIDARRAALTQPFDALTRDIERGSARAFGRSADETEAVPADQSRGDALGIRETSR